eukprot:9260765-Prorocentrum_lima.AAC.1
MDVVVCRKDGWVAAWVILIESDANLQQKDKLAESMQTHCPRAEKAAESPKPKNKPPRGTTP